MEIFIKCFPGTMSGTGRQKRCRLWSMWERKLRRRNSMFGGSLIKEFGNTICMDVNENLRLVAQMSSTHINIYDMETMAQLRTLTKPSHPSVLKFTPDGQSLVVKNTLGQFYIYTTKGFKTMSILRNNKKDKIAEGPFFVCSNSNTIVDVLVSDHIQQITSIDLVSGNRKILTQFSSESLIHAEFKIGEAYYFTRRKLNHSIDDYEYELIEITTNGQETTKYIPIPKNFKWEAIHLIPRLDLVMIVLNKEIHIYNSTMDTIVKKIRLSTNNDSYFVKMSISTSTLLALILYNNKIFIFDIKAFTIVSSEELENAAFAEFTSKDKDIVIGTWNKGYVISNVGS